MIALTRNKLLTVIYCLLVATWACTLVATAGAQESLPSKTVRYSDLDISNPEGAKALFHRIRAAARDVCELSASTDPILSMSNKVCIDTAIDRAVRKVNAPMLTNLRFGSSDVRLASK